MLLTAKSLTETLSGHLSIIQGIKKAKVQNVNIILDYYSIEEITTVNE